MNNKYVYEMDLVKMIFTFVVILYHFGMMHNNIIMGGGYLAVDFFFIVSGYLMRNSIEKHITPKDTLMNGFKKIIWSRAMNLYPSFILAWIAAFLVIHVLSGETSYLSDVWAAKQELFLIHLFGIYSEKSYLSPVWYLSAMFIAMAIILPPLFYSKRRELFTYYCPIISLSIYTVFSQTLGHGRGERDYLFLTTYGVYRAVAGLCLGNFAFQFVQKFKYRSHYNIFTRVLVTASIYGITIFLLYRFHMEYLSQNDFGYIFMIFVLVILVMSGVSYTNTLFTKIKLKIDKFNLALYFNHNYLIIIPILYKFESFGSKLAVFLLITIVVSIGMILLNQGIRFIYNQFRH